jgi:hypothetical protein
VSFLALYPGQMVCTGQLVAPDAAALLHLLHLLHLLLAPLLEECCSRGSRRPACLRCGRGQLHRQDPGPAAVDLRFVRIAGRRECGAGRAAAQVEAQMKEVRLLQIDVTVNNQDDRALMRKFGLFGPPGIILFKQGREVPQSRIIGYMGPDRFARHLSRHFAS